MAKKPDKDKALDVLFPVTTGGAEDKTGEGEIGAELPGKIPSLAEHIETVRLTLERVVTAAKSDLEVVILDAAHLHQATEMVGDTTLGNAIHNIGARAEKLLNGLS